MTEAKKADEVKKPVVADEIPEDLSKEEKELDYDIKIALEQQARLQQDRAESPDVLIGNKYEDQMDQLVRRYVPEAIPEKNPRGRVRQPGEFMKGATKRAYWGENTPARHSSMLMQGWMPVVRMIGGKRKQVTSPNGDMLLYERPIVYTHDAINRSIKMAEIKGKSMKKADVADELLYEDDLTISKASI